ncbi:zinc finger 492-like [Octopus vulgaris]|uniref:Zinc finger 492-like n=1 Tax=Octopus vulgaris TaxID=6645 RepID=A0AA36BS36_OCTVU|nr:zinc finger 492-like [Octopus vulgaris]
MLNKMKKTYHCDVCKKSVSHKSNFPHKCFHTGGKPYHCNSCGKVFATTNYLTAHKRIHTGERPYRCDIYGKSFSQNFVTTHKRIHTGEKPYYCSICDKSFSEKKSLNYTQPYSYRRNTISL